MRKILFAIFILLLVSAIGLAVFLITFDIEKYKPFIISKAEETTGKGITLDTMILSFKDGLGLNFTDLKIYPNLEKTGTPSLAVKNGTMLISLSPLLKREVRINKLIFKDPDINLVLGEKGVTSIGGFDIAETDKQKTKPSKPEKVYPTKTLPKKKTPLSFFISLIEISNGTVTIIDSTSSFLSSPLTINYIDVTLRDIAISSPVRFDIKMSFFSTVQNIIANGTCIISTDGQAKLENSDLNIDLAQFNMSGVLKTFPSLRSSGITGNIAGKLDLNVRSMYLDPNKMNETDAALDLSGGRFKFNSVPSDFSDINMQATLKSDTLSISKASLTFAEGAVTGKGTVQNITGNKSSSLEADLKGLSITTLIPPPSGNAAYVSGNVSGHIKSKSKGFNWPAMANTITADGRLSLGNFVLNNKNIVREVFSQISAIPGLVNNLESRLSEEYKNKLKEKDTSFYPIDIDMHINNSTLHCKDINIKTDDFSVIGNLELGLVNQSLGGKMFLLIGPELSLACVKIVNELVHIENSNNEIEIPVKLKGSVTNVEVIPDLNYLAKKIITTEIQNNVRDLLKEAFSKEKDPAQTAPEDTTGTEQQQETTYSEGPSSIADLFRKALQEQMGQ